MQEFLYYSFSLALHLFVGGLILGVMISAIAAPVIWFWISLRRYLTERRVREEQRRWIEESCG